MRNKHVGDYIATKDWAIAPMPIDHVHPHITLVAKESGVAGKGLAFLGNFSQVKATNGCHAIQLLIPPNVEPATSPKQIVTALAQADQQTEFGYRPDRVIGVITSEEMSNYNGYAREQQFVVEADVPLRTIEGSVWFHEYVHTRQKFHLLGRMKWLKEASAQYYGIRLAYQLGYLSTAERNLYYYRMYQQVPNETQLSVTTTWENSAQYNKGAIVLAALDFRIQNATGGSQSLLIAFKRINNQGDPVTLRGFQDTVATITGAQMDTWFRQYVIEDKIPPQQTTRPPSVYHVWKWRILVFSQLYPLVTTFFTGLFLVMIGKNVRSWRG